MASRYAAAQLIVDPAGKNSGRRVTAGREELIQAEISSKVIDDVRNRVPAFAHRRGELYNIN